MQHEKTEPPWCGNHTRYSVRLRGCRSRAILFGCHESSPSKQRHGVGESVLLLGFKGGILEESVVYDSRPATQSHH